MTEFDRITVSIDADTSAFRREVSEATALANGFGRAMTRAFEDAIVRGRDFSDVMRGLALRLSSMTVNAALRPVEQGFGALLQNLFTANGIAPAIGAPMNILPFAKGGVIATPSYFPTGASLGLAGERGAEAILPLARGADGRLGVRAGGEARPMNVTVHISTPDAASFRRSEAYVAGQIARAVARGERSL
jgi:phage-related minor tail protein